MQRNSLDSQNNNPNPLGQDESYSMTEKTFLLLAFLFVTSILFLLVSAIVDRFRLSKAIKEYQHNKLLRRMSTSLNRQQEEQKNSYNALEVKKRHNKQWRVLEDDDGEMLRIVNDLEDSQIQDNLNNKEEDQAEIDAPQDKTSKFRKRKVPPKQISPSSSSLNPSQNHVVSNGIISWGNDLPSYDPVMQTKDELGHAYQFSQKEFAFINKHLFAELKEVEKECLFNLCKNGTRGGERRSGYIVMNAQLNKKQNYYKAKESNKSKANSENEIKFIKVKNHAENFRFFGKSIARKKDLVLFEINGLRRKHNDVNITYYPSELGNK